MADGLKRVALIVGVTGLVGNSLAQILPLPTTPGGPWKVYGVARRPLPPWIADCQMEYIQCDTANAAVTHAKLYHLTDVTDIFWVAWASSHISGITSCEINGAMFRNVLATVIPNAPRLRHICLQTGARHYMLSHAVLPPGCEIRTHDPPFTEDMPRLNTSNYYYTLEDILLEEISKRNDNDECLPLTWSVHRPGLIFGFSPQGLLNFMGTLCVYAAICKHEQIPLKFPGTRAAWNDYSDASDADLVAEQQIWAAVDPRGKNEAFNITNGDLIQWKHLWRALADEFGLEFVEFDENEKPIQVTEIMKDKGPVWDKIVRENELMVTKLEGFGLWLADAYFGQEKMLISSMNKSKEHGFLGFRNSKSSFLYWVKKLRARKVVP